MAVRTERRDDVAVVVLDRPERRNALDLETMAALGGAVIDASDARVLASAVEGVAAFRQHRRPSFRGR